MTPHIEVTQEIMENINLHDTMILTDTVKAINETVQDQLIAFRDINHEVRIDFETTRAIA